MTPVLVLPLPIVMYSVPHPAEPAESHTVAFDVPVLKPYTVRFDPLRLTVATVEFVLFETT